MFSPIHTPAFDLAYHFVAETNDNIFLTGKAGTGKTTFLKYIRENLPKRMAVAAPTGVAAINAGGVTLHSMFHLPFGPFVPGNHNISNVYNRQSLLGRLRYNHEKITFLQTLELLVIDEVSMVSSFLLDEIDTILRFVRHRNDLPFGGVQLLFIGDLYQLQPVIKQDEWQLLRNHYNSIFFFDSHVLRENIPVILELKEIFRQHDEGFINILNGIRDNNITSENLTILNKRVDRNFKSSEGDGYITLTTHNNQADSLNDIRLRRLNTPSEKFIAEIDGDFPESMYPGEKELVLKKNAQVMFTKNDTEEKKYFNGKIGIVSSLSDEEIIVTCDDKEIIVQPHTWENIRYTNDATTKEIKEQVLGTFRQYPLRLAWAITIHKSQGLTFDKLVIDAENAFVKGQVYVALSRATRLEGIVLSSPVNDRFLGAHESLASLHENQKDDDSLKTQFEISRQKFIEMQMFGVFSFSAIHHSLSNLKKHILELKQDEVAKNWINDLSARLNNLRDISNKFENEIRKLLDINPSVEENEILQKRISEASKYFSDQNKTITSIFLEHPFIIKNRTDAKQFDKSLIRIADAIKESTAKIDCCVHGFRMNDFLLWKKKCSSISWNIRSTYSSRETEKPEAIHAELNGQLTNFRNMKAVELDVPEYMVFSNNAIRNCCEQLPGDLDSLLAVSGFGKRKVEQFGKDVIIIIRDYCRENNIEPNIIKQEEGTPDKFRQKKTSLSTTVMETIELFRSGKNIDEIVKTRKLVSSTIEGHLAVGIRNKLLNINNILSHDELEEMKKLFNPDSGSLDLADAREKSKSKFSYGKLKMVQSHLITEKQGDK